MQYFWWQPNNNLISKEIDIFFCSIKLSYTYDSLRNISSIYTRINNVAFSNWQYEYDEYQNTLKSEKLYKGAGQTEYFDSYSQESF